MSLVSVGVKGEMFDSTMHVECASVSGTSVRVVCPWSSLSTLSSITHCVRDHLARRRGYDFAERDYESPVVLATRKRK